MYDERQTALVFPKSAATVSITASIALFRSVSLSIGIFPSSEINFSIASTSFNFSNHESNSFPEIHEARLANREPHFHEAAHVLKSLAVNDLPVTSPM